MQHGTIFTLLAPHVKAKMKNKTPQPLIVKKYENRRLYNTLTSQYINQEQVAQLVRDGQDVRVIDAATGEDITRLIMAQIVLEDAKTPDSVFPLDVLRQMIVASGKATQENTLRYMKAMMEMYQNAYRAMPSPLNPFEFMPNLWGQPKDKEELAQVSERTGENPGGHGPDPKSAAGAPPSEVTELRRRIEELEEALSRGKRGKKASKTKSRRKS
jgi:polyhydroxyalkanoate synthesis repressor PhaR